MNIEFVKQGNAYVAEFKVEADFNLLAKEVYVHNDWE